MKLLYLLVPLLVVGLVAGYTMPATTFKGNVTMGDNNIVGLAEPSLNTDAATKSYVDNSTDESLYAALAGRAGGQTLYGGIAAGQNLTIASTAHATKGLVMFGSSAHLDEVTGRFAFNLPIASPTVDISADGTIYGITSGSELALYNVTSSDWDLLGGECYGVCAINSSRALVFGGDNCLFMWSAGSGFVRMTATPLP